jgi:two-component system OmpR family response regulator
MLSSIVARTPEIEPHLTGMRSRILLLSGARDNSLLREFLSEDASVRVVEDATSGVSLACSGAYHLFVLDLSGPRIGGLEVLRMLRARSDLPIVVLSGRTPGDRIAALQLGADDCMSVPCNYQELVARVQAILRRYARTTNSSQPIEIRPVRIDPGSRSVWVGDCLVELTSTEYLILETLMREAGRVVTRDRLTWTVRQCAAAGFERTLDVHVARLRKKIGRPSPIGTVRGEGYFFRCEPVAG